MSIRTTPRRYLYNLLGRKSYIDTVRNIAPSNLIQYLPLDETSGSIAYDVSGNNRNGTYSRVKLANIDNASPLMGKAGYFNGINSYINLYSASLASAFNVNAGTVFLWTRIDRLATWTDGNFRYFFNIGVDGSNLIRAWKTNGSNAIQLTYSAGGTAETITPTISDTEWFNIAITWDKVADEVKIYINGGQSGSTQTTLGAWSGALNSSLCAIGTGNISSISNVNNGYISHFAIWNKALTASEIETIAKPPSQTSYILQDLFTTKQAAPLTTPRTSGLSIVDTGNIISIDSGRLVSSGIASSSYIDPRIVSTSSYERILNRTFIFSVNTDIVGAILGWRNVSSGGSGNIIHSLYWSGATQIAAWNGSVANVLANVTTNTNYLVAIVLRSTGAFMFIKGGAFLNWTFVWEFKNSNATGLFPSLQGDNTNGNRRWNFATVKDLSLLTSDNSIATLNQTNFTQSLGSELLTNGDFSLWSGDNPNGWTVVGEIGSDPMVTQVAPDGSAYISGNASVRLYSSATNNNPEIQQNLAISLNDFVEVFHNTTVRTSGSFRFEIGNDNSPTFNTASNRTNIIRYNSGSNLLRYRNIGVAPIDHVLDNISIKKLTLNTIQTATMNGLHEFGYVLPVSPVLGEESHLLYRINATGEEFYNCFDAYITRVSGTNDFKLDSIVNGTRTNRINVGSVGVPTAIRVVADGNLHDCYTIDSSDVITKRGGQITNALYNTSKLVNTIYSSTITPTYFRSYPRTGVISNTPQINVNSFTQSISGVETITNNTFSTWSGNNPVNWTVLETPPDPTLTEVDPSGGVGTGAAKFFSSATELRPAIQQSIVGSSEKIYEFTSNISAYTSSRIDFQFGAFILGSHNATGNKKILVKFPYSSNGNNTLSVYSRTPPADLVLNEVSLKEITTNTIYSAGYEGVFESEFTIPVSPVAGDTYEMLYRYLDTGNNFVVRLVRNDANTNWDIYLIRHLNHIPTQNILSSNTGTIDKIRVTVINDLHILETFNSGVSINRGSATDTTHNTIKDYLVVYTSGFTPVAQRYYPLNLSYSELDRI